MKKNPLQVVALCLCIVLLVITIIQGKQLAELRDWMDFRFDNLGQSVTGQIENIPYQLGQKLEEAGKTVADYTVEPVGIDRENRALLADVFVTLKEWYEDTEVTLLADTNNNLVFQPMENQGNGVFTAMLSVPLEGECTMVLDAQISGGGLRKQENLGAWGDFSMFLPVQSTGGGWSGPDFYDGALHSEFYINLQNKDGEAVEVYNPEFRVYKNGQLVQTLPAVRYLSLSDEFTSSYTVSVGPEGWSVECEEDDSIAIRFRCEGEFGIGFDFPFMTWTAEGELIEGPGMTLFWTE